MKKVLITLLITIALFSACKKSQQQNNQNNQQESTPEFNDGVVVFNTHYYKDAKMKLYGGPLKRGQKIVLGNNENIISKNNTKFVMMNFKMPESDDVLWVIGKYITSSGWELKNVYKTSRKIRTVKSPNAFYYQSADTLSRKTEIKQGVKVIVLEERATWSKIHTTNKAKPIKWMKTEDLTDSDVDFEIKKYITGIGNCIITTSSNFAKTLGYERSHTGDMAFDNNNRTAWIEGADGNGIGEWIKIQFKDGTYRFKISMINGLATEKLYKINNRVKKIRIETDSINKVIDLEDENMNFQELGEFEGSYIKLTIEEVYPGKDKDTSISEIKIKHLTTTSSNPSSQGTGNDGAQNFQ